MEPVQIDPILQLLYREMPHVVPRFGESWSEYLLSWAPVVEDESGSLRPRMQALRTQLRDELGIAPDGGTAGTAETTGRAGAGGTSADWHRSLWIDHLWLLYERNLLDSGAESFLPDRLVDFGEADFGGYDAVCLWQSYPRLGLDHRNQFDYYRDLPGGIPELRRTVDRLHARNVHVFLNYNPWDNGTRREQRSDAETLASFIVDTGADGVFLDTQSSCDPLFRRELSAVRADIALCPELLPPLSELATLTGSWQQFAVPNRQELVAHRWLDPRFRLRLVDRNARSHREQLSVAFLHGTGHVVWENIFGWWNPWSDADRLLLKQTVALLRACVRFFSDPQWQPFVPTGCPGVYANEWHCGDETLFTLYNTNEHPCDSVTLTLGERSGTPLFDLWNRRELLQLRGGRLASYRIGAGEVGCIIASRSTEPVVLPCEAGESERHRPVTLAAYKARPVPVVTKATDRGERDMVAIPGGSYTLQVHRACNPAMEGGSYGDISRVNAQGVPDQHFWLAAYAIDRTPVTKAAFERFLHQSRYLPRQLDNFLADWTKPSAFTHEPWQWSPPDGKENHPVVWVSLEDARAYAAFVGARLPTEAEWQLAAEGSSARKWPWGERFDPTCCNNATGDTTAVLEHLSGASQWGCLDMCGNVWEWTESERDDGHTRYVMVRAGSHLRVAGSIWYTASGPQPCDVHEKVLLLGGGIDRLSTVGFRCVQGR